MAKNAGSTSASSGKLKAASNSDRKDQIRKEMDVALNDRLRSAFGLKPGVSARKRA